MEMRPLLICETQCQISSDRTRTQPHEPPSNGRIHAKRNHVHRVCLRLRSFWHKYVQISRSEISTGLLEMSSLLWCNRVSLLPQGPWKTWSYTENRAHLEIQLRAYVGETTIWAPRRKYILPFIAKIQGPAKRNEWSSHLLHCRAKEERRINIPELPNLLR